MGTGIGTPYGKMPESGGVSDSAHCQAIGSRSQVHLVLFGLLVDFVESLYHYLLQVLVYFSSVQKNPYWSCTHSK
jgi:hypothetical protein